MARREIDSAPIQASSSTWMVRAGEGGTQAEAFAKGEVAVGWSKIGDLTNERTREAIQKRYLAAYPDHSRGRVINAVGVLHKFRNVMGIGTRVITYDPEARDYLIGTITGDYVYDPKPNERLPHHRRVKWLSTAGRDGLPAFARNSLGSTLTVFEVNEDVLAQLLAPPKRTDASEVLDAEKADLEEIREDTVGKAHELIKDQILELDDDELEELTAAILRALGYRARVTPKGPDRGVDVFASPDGLGLQAPRIKAEVKHRSKTPMGSQDLRSFLGGLREGDRGLYVSTGGFTKEARYEAERSNNPVTLIDLSELASLVVTHYEQFDTEGRVLLPLVKVYMPVR